jgi:predicted amidohydrolase
MPDLIFTLIQTNLLWENKAPNLQMLGDKIQQTKGQTQIVVLPEMFSTGFSMSPEKLAETMAGPTLQWMKEMSADHKIILTGSLIIEEEKKYYNRLIWMQPNGQFEYYDKRHLFAFGKEDYHYTAGEKRLIVSINDWKINLQICYDLRFPIWARQSEANEYDVLLYVANWPERRIHAWKSLLVARAIENQCYVVAVNRVGNDGNDIYHNGCSMVINPLGEILYQKEYDEDMFTITLKKEVLEEVRSKFPFWKDADKFEIL